MVLKVGSWENSQLRSIETRCSEETFTLFNPVPNRRPKPLVLTRNNQLGSGGTARFWTPMIGARVPAGRGTDRRPPASEPPAAEQSRFSRRNKEEFPPGLRGFGAGSTAGLLTLLWPQPMPSPRSGATRFSPVLPPVLFSTFKLREKKTPSAAGRGGAYICCFHGH